MAEVMLRKVIKRYDEVEAVRGIDLDIADHEFVVLVGPSGCGKSTTLRMIAGLEDITDGDIMIGYFASITKELDEAAIIDGASWFQTLTRIFIPVALPGLIAATIFAFTVSWAQFLYPLVFTTSTDQLVLPVGIITTLIKGDVFNWGQIMTGALLGAAPPLIIYAFLMDYYIAGLTAGATKG
jgi:ABC-type maltose transport system permease subunit